ncbi:MAG: MFS transporter [Chloroflexi bacterium]|nr:MFS transporter [Chloroflexota bacterium]
MPTAEIASAAIAWAPRVRVIACADVKLPSVLKAFPNWFIQAIPRARTARPSDISRRPPAIFDSFRIRSFRFQWCADGLATWASEIDILVLGWFVLVETDSPFLVGLLGALRFTGTLLGPFYGIVVDRLDRTKLFAGVRLFMAAIAAALMTLVVTGALETWHIFIIATLTGLGRQFDLVVRQSLLADVVPRETLVNALGWARSMIDAAKITGALAGGQLLAHLGLGQAYLATTALYLASSVFALGATVGVAKRAISVGGAWQQFRSGFRFMAGEQTILAMLFLAFLVNLTAFPLTNGLLPVVARDVFHAGPTGLSLLAACAAAGALAGSIGMAVIGRSARPARATLLAVFAWHAVLLVFAFLPSIGSAAAVLVGFGVATSAAMVTMQAVLMTATAPEYRGRVMGVRALAIYGLPIGLLAGGWLAEAVSVEATILVLGAVGLALTGAAALKWPHLRNT